MAIERTEQRRRYSASEIRKKLSDADGALATGQSVSSICERLGITRQTYYRWRKSLEAFGSGSAADNFAAPLDDRLAESGAVAKRGKAASLERLEFLEAENQRLRDAVVALMLEKMTLTKK